MVTLGCPLQAIGIIENTELNTKAPAYLIQDRPLFTNSFCDQFCNIEHLRPATVFFSCLLGKHSQTKWTTGRDSLRAGLLELTKPIGTHPLFASLLILPELSTTGAATKTIVTSPFRLNEIGACHLDQRTRLLEDSIVTPKIARVVISYRGSRIWLNLELAITDQLANEFSVMSYYVVAAKLRVFIANCVKAVWTSRDDDFAL